MTINMLIATSAWLLLTAGLVLRRNLKLHISFTCSAIALDVALVAYLQVTRQAVQTALDFKLDLLEQVHIGFSTLALLLYFVVVPLGIMLLRTRKPLLRRWHVRVALSAYVARTCGFVFMFSMLP